jgi:hypothetical protein
MARDYSVSYLTFSYSSRQETFMLNQLKRNLWESFTMFRDLLFLREEECLEASLDPFLRLLRPCSRQWTVPKIPLTVETLEPRWLLNGTVLANNSYDWGIGSQEVIVNETVTANATGYSGLFLWQFQVENISFIGDGGGVGIFDVPFTPTSDVSNVTGPDNWYPGVGTSGALFGIDGVSWVGNDVKGYGISAGQSGDFAFTTDPRTLNLTYGSVWSSDVNTETEGPLLTPGSGAPSLMAGSANVSVQPNQTVHGTSVIQSFCWDTNSEPISFVSNTNASNGTVIFNPDGSYTYTPNAGYVGPDSFTYTVSDGTDLATGTININTPEAPVVPSEACYSAPPGGTLQVANPNQGLLANASDPSGNSLSVISYTQPTNGSVTVNPDGTFQYTPNVNSGYDAFSYTVSDGTLTTVGYVNISISTFSGTLTGSDNDPYGDTFSGTFSGGLSGNSLSSTFNGTLNNNGSNPYIANGDPATGTLSGTFNATIFSGTFAFQDSNTGVNFAGTASGAINGTTLNGTISGTDPFGNAVSGTLDINLASCAPIVVNQSYQAYSNLPLTVSSPSQGLLAGAYDPNGDPMSIASYTQPANGSVTVNPNGTFTYTPAPGYAGPDSFTFTVTDGLLAAAPAVANIQVADPVWYWNGPGDEASNWSTTANWELEDANNGKPLPIIPNSYPGGPNGTDAWVQFSNPNAGTAVLDQSVTIYQVKFTAWNGTLFLNNSLTVSGGIFQLMDGTTISLANGQSLSLVGGQTSIWSSGNIVDDVPDAGDQGTAFNVIGTQLYIDDLPVSLGTNMVIAGIPQQDSATTIPGSVIIANMKGTVSLNGPSNYIDVQNGGTLYLDQTIPSDNDSIQGAIISNGTGSSLAIKIETGGQLIRDDPAPVPGVEDSQMVGGYIYNEGGTVNITSGNLAIIGTNSLGYSYWQDTAASSVLQIGNNTTFFALGTLEIDYGTLQFFGGSSGGPQLQSAGLTFGDDDPTFLVITGWKPGGSIITIEGSVTLGDLTTTTLNYSGLTNTADTIAVLDGTLTLDGTLFLQDVDEFQQPKPTAGFAFLTSTGGEGGMDGVFASIQDSRTNAKDTGLITSMAGQYYYDVTFN